MRNSVLFRRSSFFVDAINIIFHVDLFLYHELTFRMKECKMLEDVFTNVPKFNSDNKVELDKMVIDSCSKKVNQNILLDWVSKDKFSNYSINMSLNEYVARLYMDMLINPICEQYLQVTEFGNTLKLLSKDIQLNKLCIYIPFDSDFLKSNISDLFMRNPDNSLSILIGDKKEFMKDHKFDSYIFENATDIDNYLAIPENKTDANILIEVIIPSYNFNMKEDRTDLDILIEQITYYRLNLKLEDKEYYSNYRLAINTLAVPF